MRHMTKKGPQENVWNDWKGAIGECVVWLKRGHWRMCCMTEKRATGECVATMELTGSYQKVWTWLNNGRLQTLKTLCWTNQGLTDVWFSMPNMNTPSRCHSLTHGDSICTGWKLEFKVNAAIISGLWIIWNVNWATFVLCSLSSDGSNDFFTKCFSFFFFLCALFAWVFFQVLLIICAQHQSMWLQFIQSFPFLGYSSFQQAGQAILYMFSKSRSNKKLPTAVASLMLIIAYLVVEIIQRWFFAFADTLRLSKSIHAMHKSTITHAWIVLRSNAAIYLIKCSLFF